MTVPQDCMQVNLIELRDLLHEWIGVGILSRDVTRESAALGGRMSRPLGNSLRTGVGLSNLLLMSINIYVSIKHITMRVYR